MARLSDVPKVIRSVGFVVFARRVWSEVNKDNLFTWAAALAYSWLFAIFPFLIFLLALVPHLPEKTKAVAREEIHRAVLELPHPAARMVWDNIDKNLENILHRPQGKLLYLGLAISLWAASGGMAATMSALDRCYELEDRRPFHKHRAAALTMTIFVALMLLVVVCLLPVGSVVKVWVLSRISDLPLAAIVAFDISRWMLALTFMVSVLALVYHAGPNIKQRFYWLSPGSAFCLVVWVVLGLLFRLYIDRFGSRGYDRTYGTVGGVAVLLLFFYIDALVLLIGAEINSEIDFEVLKVRRGACDFRYAVKTDPVPTSI